MSKERFSDGNMADVFRVGDRVRKQRGAWWDATRQVLDHLAAEGYAWSPRVFAASDDQVELSYISGATIAAGLTGARDERTLCEMGHRARELHNALDGFRFSPGTTFVPWPVRPEDELIICHNDLSPWNSVFDNGDFRGFIDWDLVSMATREWELAWMCWRWAPIYPTGDRTDFTVTQQAERCRILLDAYGLDAIDRTGFVDLIDQRMQCAVDVVEQLGAEGVPGFDRLLATGRHLSGLDDRAWLNEHRCVFQQTIESD